MTIFYYFAGASLFLILSAFFSSMETSIFSLPIIQRKELTSKNRSIEKIFSDLSSALISILFANTFVNIGFSLSADKIFNHFISNTAMAMFVSICSATLIVLILGEILPKNFAIFHKKFLLIKGSFPLKTVVLILKPVNWVSQFLVSNIVGRIKHLMPKAYPRLMKDELITLAGLHLKKSSFNATEKKLLQNIIKISQLNIGDILTPRVKTDMIDVSKTEKEIHILLKKYKHRFIPAYKEGIDNIIGIIDVKNYMISENSLIKHIKKPVFIPETKKILQEFTDMKKREMPFSIVVDEYGGFVGVVDIEDIVEEITGDISDEFDSDEKSIKTVKKNHFIIPGDTRLVDIEELTRSSLQGESSDTINAFILQKFGKIPKKGFYFNIDDKMLFIILKASKTKIIEVELKIT